MRAVSFALLGGDKSKSQETYERARDRLQERLDRARDEAERKRAKKRRGGSILDNIKRGLGGE